MNLYIKSVSKPLQAILLLLISSSIEKPLSAEELTRDYFNGLQLAFVRKPAVPLEEEPVVQPKPIQTPAPAVKPVPQPAPVTPPVPAIKPTPATVIKPAQEVKPVVKQAPVVKPAQKEAAKTAPPIKPSKAAASGSKQAVEWIIGIGYEMGGDTLGNLNFADGSSVPVKANEGLLLFAGVIFPTGSYPNFSTQVSLGYKYGGARGGGGGAIWTAIPLDVIEFYRMNDLRMGLGISYHLNPQLSVSVPGTSYVDKYDNALGLVAQIGWSPVREPYGIDLRYTSIKFQGNNVVGPASASGSVAGLYASYRF